MMAALASSTRLGFALVILAGFGVAGACSRDNPAWSASAGAATSTTSGGSSSGSTSASGGSTSAGGESSGAVSSSGGVTASGTSEATTLASEGTSGSSGSSGTSGGVECALDEANALPVGLDTNMPGLVPAPGGCGATKVFDGAMAAGDASVLFTGGGPACGGIDPMSYAKVIAGASWPEGGAPPLPVDNCVKVLFHFREAANECVLVGFQIFRGGAGFIPGDAPFYALAAGVVALVSNGPKVADISPVTEMTCALADGCQDLAAGRYALNWEWAGVTMEDGGSGDVGGLYFDNRRSHVHAPDDVSTPCAAHVGWIFRGDAP